MMAGGSFPSAATPGAGLGGVPAPLPLLFERIF